MTDPLPALFEKLNGMCVACEGERNLQVGYADTALCEEYHAALDEIAERQHINGCECDLSVRATNYGRKPDPDCTALRKECRGDNDRRQA